MIKYYFKLQLTLLSRKIKAFGLAPMLGFFILPLAFIAVSYLLFSRVPYFKYIYPVIAVSLLLNFNDRSKDRFLHSNCSKSDYRLIRLMENLCIALPFIIFLIAKQYFSLAAILFLISMALSFLNLAIGQRHLPTPFSKLPFEFTVGFRKSILIIIASYFILVMAIHVDNFNLGLSTLGLSYLICLAYYHLMEPAHYVSIFNDSPKSFLFRKIKTGLLYSTLSALPIACLLLILYPHRVLPVFLIMCIGLILISITIISKYSSFPDTMSVGDSILLGISIIFPPLLLFTLPKLYRKSLEHLKPLLP